VFAQRHALEYRKAMESADRSAHFMEAISKNNDEKG
jgi:hypothetical protein